MLARVPWETSDFLTKLALRATAPGHNFPKKVTKFGNFEQKTATSFGQLRQKFTYFLRNLCEHWEGLSGAPASSLRWANVGAGASLRWPQQEKFHILFFQKF